MQSNGVGDRSKWVMRRNPHLISLRHGSNLLCLKQTTAMAKIRLNHVARASLEQRLELVASNQSFASGNRHLHPLADLAQRLDVLGWHRFLTKERPKLADGVDVLDCHTGIRAAVKVDHDVDRVTNAGSQFFH